MGTVFKSSSHWLKIICSKVDNRCKASYCPPIIIQLVNISLYFLEYHSRPCARLSAWDSSTEFMAENPQGCIVILAVPELMVLKALEYPESSANGAFTNIILFRSPFGNTSLIWALRRDKSAIMPDIRSLGATICKDMMGSNSRVPLVLSTFWTHCAAVAITKESAVPRPIVAL